MSKVQKSPTILKHFKNSVSQQQQQPIIIIISIQAFLRTYYNMNTSGCKHANVSRRWEMLNEIELWVSQIWTKTINEC